MNAATNPQKGGSTQCPVCHRFAHAADCPMRGLMALTWEGKSPDERAAEAHGEHGGGMV